MKYAFYIYFTAIGIYALVTLPVLIAPWMYIISIGYVLLYGWFACFLFSLVFGILLLTRLQHHTKMAILAAAVVAAVAFAFQMIDVVDPSMDVWHSGGFMLFPVAAVVAGWISLFQYQKKFLIREEKFEFEQNDLQHGSGV